MILRAWPFPAPLVADGALGTMLLQNGPLVSPLEALTISEPQRVGAVHRAYRAAGASVVQTNSFGAARLMLPGGGWNGPVAPLVAAAAALAHGAAPGALIAGTLGPLGQPPGWSAAHAAEAARCYREPLDALHSAGADLLLLETHYDTQEAALAVAIARRCAPAEFPVACTFAVRPDLRLACGCPVERAAGMALDAGADAVGVNCGDGPATALAAARRIAAAFPGVWLIVQPSAGLPNSDGRGWPVTPQDFAGFAVEAMELGAVLVGGCCGTTPAHIAAVCAAVAPTS
ncbi:MAG: homocysteine S-methyltransferase family protein [Chloroflexi bacterium]|nr:homocysteine S-methyltransferase family protein [Chloroflexota bacterium]